MARIYDPSPEDEAMWREWVASRPEIVRVVAERFTPWELYRMRSTGQRVRIMCFKEPDGPAQKVDLCVHVSAEFNPLIEERLVFGIDPDDLEPCELPRPGEALGPMLEEYLSKAALALAPSPSRRTH